MVSSDSIIQAARECLGTPFKHQGRQPHIGLDCVGLVRWPAVKLGLNIGDRIDYPRTPNPAEMIRTLSQYLDIIQKPEPGCIILFKIQGLPRHLAIYTGDTIIHSVENASGRVVEHGYRSPWPDRAVAYFKYRD